MKLPSFQFYPGDWLKDPNLRRCSVAARGVWIDMLCLMFECEERGALVSSGVPWEDVDVHVAIGGDPSVVASCLSELLAKGVVRRREDAALCSRRMVRDERIRQERAISGALGGKRAKQNRSKPPSKHKANSQQSPEDEDEDEKSLTVGGSKGGVRRPNPLWDAVVAEWGLPLATKTQQTRVGNIVRELKGAGAKPEEIAGRRKRMAAAWGPEKATPESVAKHWGQFAPNAPAKTWKDCLKESDERKARLRDTR